LERDLKGNNLGLIEILYRFWSGGSEENAEILGQDSGVSDENRTEHFSNKNINV
jgi:hypothetical protein